VESGIAIQPDPEPKEGRGEKPFPKRRVKRAFSPAEVVVRLIKLLEFRPIRNGEQLFQAASRTTPGFIGAVNPEASVEKLSDGLIEWSRTNDTAGFDGSCLFGKDREASRR
jgi:hypothetical protein